MGAGPRRQGQGERGHRVRGIHDLGLILTLSTVLAAPHTLCVVLYFIGIITFLDLIFLISVYQSSCLSDHPPSRFYFWTISRAFLSAVPRHTRRVANNVTCTRA